MHFIGWKLLLQAIYKTLLPIAIFEDKNLFFGIWVLYIVIQLILKYEVPTLKSDILETPYWTGIPRLIKVNTGNSIWVQIGHNRIITFDPHHNTQTPFPPKKICSGKQVPVTQKVVTNLTQWPRSCFLSNGPFCSQKKESCS